MNAGFDSGPLVGEADLIIVIESDAPWYPGMQQPAAGCRVAHIGEDPVFVRYPMRSFPSDLSIASPAAIVLAALDAALAQKTLNAEARRAQADRAPQRAPREGREGSASATALNAATFSRAVGEAVGDDAIIFNEYPLSLDHCAREKPGTFYGLSAAGGLGWGLGAAMGAKLAAPEKFVVATVGDGAYMFANPTVCHWVADKFDHSGAHRHLQQQPLRRGAARDALDVQGRRGRRGRRPVPRRPLALAAVRGIRALAGRPRRARRTSMPSSRPRSRARATRCAAAAGRSSTFSFPTDRKRSETSCASTRTRISFRRNISSG